jgi:serine/threonine-protein kinase
MSAVSNASVASPKLCPSCGNRYPVDALFCPIDGTPLTSAAGASGQSQDPYVGREILGHIEIKQLAGIGAMGRVYRAFQTGIDRDVAVKILHRELSTNQQLVARFHREAKVASRLQHANVVHVLLTGQLPDGAMYIVMEYLAGLSMQSALAGAGGAMPLPRALHIALQLCDATGEAHAQGVVHRDIKPENVMLVHRGDDDDFVKVLDFGIARLNWGDQSMATAAGLIFGTARYISPEGAQGETVGPQSDVYSIATLIYQMLSGRTPFEGEQAVALHVAQIHEPPPPQTSIARAGYVPDPIAEVVMKNLAKRPEDRHPDARALGRALLDAARASGLSPEDLVSRAMMMSGRASGPMQIASMQRTRQLRLDAETTEKLGAASPQSPQSPQSPKRPTGTEIEPLPRGNATTKWTPPADVQAQMAAGVPPPRTSNVDITMDDDDVAQNGTPPPPRGTAPPRTQQSPVHAQQVQTKTQPIARVQIATPAPAFTPMPSPSHTPLPSPPPSRRAVSSHPSKPPSGVDSTLSDEEASPRRAKSRAAVLVFFCFLLGVGGAAGVAYKLGLMGPATPQITAESIAAHANDALIHQRWDAPPGDNVRDLTNDGLARWPHDMQLLRIRALACDDLVRIGRTTRQGGDLVEALRLARLAHELDPSDGDATSLVAKCEAEIAAKASPASDDAGLAPLTLPTSSVAAKSTSALLDVKPPHARVGQPVDFVAHVVITPATAARPTIDAPYFQISGPGIANGAKIPAVCDAQGTCRGGYTFLEAGHYDIAFTAKAGGAALRAARQVQAGNDVKPLPPGTPTAPPTSDPGPQPSASAKWM